MALIAKNQFDIMRSVLADADSQWARRKQTESEGPDSRGAQRRAEAIECGDLVLAPVHGVGQPLGAAQRHGEGAPARSSME